MKVLDFRLVVWVNVKLAILVEFHLLSGSILACLSPSVSEQNFALREPIGGCGLEQLVCT